MGHVLVRASVQPVRAHCTAWLAKQATATLCAIMDKTCAVPFFVVVVVRATNLLGCSWRPTLSLQVHSTRSALTEHDCVVVQCMHSAYQKQEALFRPEHGVPWLVCCSLRLLLPALPTAAPGDVTTRDSPSLRGKEAVTGLCPPFAAVLRCHDFCYWSHHHMDANRKFMGYHHPKQPRAWKAPLCHIGLVAGLWGLTKDACFFLERYRDAFCHPSWFQVCVDRAEQLGGSFSQALRACGWEVGGKWGGLLWDLCFTSLVQHCASGCALYCTMPLLFDVCKHHGWSARQCVAEKHGGRGQQGCNVSQGALVLGEGAIR